MYAKNQNSLDNIKNIGQYRQFLGKNQEIRIKKIYHVVCENGPKKPIEETPKLIIPDSEPDIQPVIPQPVKPFYQPITQIVEQPSYLHQVPQVRPQIIPSTLPIVTTVAKRPSVAVNQQVGQTALHQSIPVVTQNSTIIPQRTQANFSPVFQAPSPVVYQTTN